MQNIVVSDHTNDVLERASWQDVVFAERLRRARLLQLMPHWALESISIRVHRNQPFELIGMMLGPFLAYANLEADFTYGDYDDSLAFNQSSGFDLEIISLDFDRYKFNNAELTSWLSGRVQELRKTTKAPILVSNAASMLRNSDELNAQLQRTLSSIPDVHLGDVASQLSALGETAWDERSAAIKATNWSDQAVLQMARLYGLNWIPALAGKLIKAIAVDLDNTLYEGILGEDGLEQIVVTNEHQQLHDLLNSLAAKGTFVALVSKNDASDVEKLFDLDDFRLRRESVATIAASWGQKADSIRNASAALHVGTDSVLFIDDNPAELLAVTHAMPEVSTILASSAEQSLNAIVNYPGIFTFKTSIEGTLRTTDIRAAQEREQALNDASDPHEYLRSLEITLTFDVNNMAHSKRMAELTTKTNQFNTSLARTSETDIVEGIDSGKLIAVTISLKDKLSVSGIIGFVLTEKIDDTIFVRELDISCRALGRSLEDAIALHALELVSSGDIARVVFDSVIGPRNEPALTWLDSITQHGALQWNASTISARIAKVPATIIDGVSQ